MKRMFSLRPLYFVPIVFLFLIVCRVDGQAPKPTAINPINIIVLLDTSDRLNQIGQVQRDIKLVGHILTRFEEFVKQYLAQHISVKQKQIVATYPHRFTVVVAEQPRTSPISQELLEKLTIKDSGDMKKWSEFTDKTKALLQEIETLYEAEIKKNLHPGADIWKWFHKDADYYLKEGFHNYIICLSDGYLSFDEDIEKRLPKGRYMKVCEYRNDPQWREKIFHLLPVGKDFSHYSATFVMMEINPHKDETTGAEPKQEFDIIIAYWEHWLNLIGIKDFKFFRQIPPTEMQDEIKSFLVLREE